MQQYQFTCNNIALQQGCEYRSSVKDERYKLTIMAAIYRVAVSP
ncbi:hypothetical protein YPH_2353 [Yersinia pestis biovar Orientalis str. PEXU2]|nr:hypothetical protein YPH_2353 [Yersinia pestis biovar Orientalis str. PEXU2]